MGIFDKFFGKSSGKETHKQTITVDDVYGAMKERDDYERARTARANTMILSPAMQSFLIDTIDKMLSFQLSELSNGKPLHENTFDLYISEDKLPCDDWITSSGGKQYYYDKHEAIILSMGTRQHWNGPFITLMNVEQEGYFGETMWANMVRNRFGYRSDVEALEDTALAIAYVLEHEYQDKRGFVYSETCDVGGVGWKTYHFSLRLPENTEPQLDDESVTSKELVKLRTTFR